MRVIRSWVVLTAALCLAVMPGARVLAASGDLDTTFSGDGKVTTRILPGEQAGAQATAIQPDGKIVAAGSTGAGGQTRFALVRYNDDGTRDATFGNDGKVTTSFAPDDCVVAHALAVQADGKIVAAGDAGCDGRIAIARYNSDGSLDTTFGGDGKVTTRFRNESPYAEAFGVALQADARIVVVGACICNEKVVFALARYLPDGSLDATFSGDGKVTTDFTPQWDIGRGIAVQSDGRIVAVGVASRDSNHSRFALARYNPDGTLDTTFSGDGKRTTQPRECVSEGHAVAIQSDGKIVAAGWSGCIDEVTLVRYRQHGGLDTDFGETGIVITPFSPCPQSAANAVALQPDSKIVIAGQVVCLGQNAERYKFGLARYNPDGSLDASFGGDGKVTTVFLDGECFLDASGVAIQSDGRIVAAGGEGCPWKFALARYLG